MIIPKATTLALAAAAALPLLLASGAGAGDGFDHLVCYSNSDLTQPNLKATADLTPSRVPPFEIQNCRIRLRSSNYCTPAYKHTVRDREGNPIAVLPIAGQPARPYMCYVLRCPPEGPKGRGFDLEVEDQFGRREIKIKRADFFCQPAFPEDV